MSLTIKILKLNEVGGLSSAPDKIVGTVEYRIISNITKKSISGYANLNFMGLTEETFIPFDQLTEETVKNWIIDCIGAERMAVIEEDLNTFTELPQVTYQEIASPWNNN